MAGFVFYIVLLVLLSISKVSLETEEELPKELFEFPKNDSFTEFVGKMNYTAEAISVVTQDNYMLRVHRLPQDKPTDKVVFIMHGMLSSSLDWVLIGRDKSIALLLHDIGYDVFLGNARGNYYSRKHLNMSTSSKAFWEFSWHEIGYYDMSSVVDMILQETNVKKLDFIGHSQGVTSFLVLNVLRPKYQKYFRTVIAMSPIAFLSNIQNTYVRLLASNADRFGVMLNALRIYEVTPSNGVRAVLSKLFCSDSSPSQDICAKLLFLTVGPGPVYLNKTLLPNIFHNVYAGVSIKQVLHFASNINSGRFQHFDYKDQNMAIYNNPVPPDYTLQTIKGMNFYLYYGTMDTLMAKRDVLRLEDHLRYKNAVSVTEIPYFNHLDYMFGCNVTEILYRSVIDLMVSRIDQR